jgi:hypothetical protein
MDQLGVNPQVEACAFTADAVFTSLQQIHEMWGHGYVDLVEACVHAEWMDIESGLQTASMNAMVT